MNIDDYIVATRQINNDVTEPLAQAYLDIYVEILKGFSFNEFDFPELLVVNTLNKQTQLVSFKNSKILICDQYLGQTINELSRIFYSAESPEDAKSMVFRIMSETASYCGENELAVTLAFLYSTAHHRSHGYKSNETIELRAKRSLSVHVQEAFIIAHELSHLSWALSNIDKTAIDWLLDFVLQVSDIDVEKVLEQYLDDLSFQYHGNPVPHAHNIKTDEDRLRDVKMRERLRNEIIESHERTVELHYELSKNDHFREEIYADWQAAQTCLELFSDTMPTDDLIIAVHLAMENITTISLVVSETYSLLNLGIEYDSRAVGARKRALRRSLEQWVSEHVPSMQDGCLKFLADSNARYMNFVRDPMTINIASDLISFGLFDEAIVKSMYGDIIEAIPNASDPQFIIKNRPFK